MHIRAPQDFDASTQVIDSIGTTTPSDTAWLTDFIPLGFIPGSIAMSPDEKTLYISHQDASAISVIDVLTGQTTKEIYDAGAGRITVSPDGCLLYTLANNRCYVIDTQTHEISESIPAPKANRTLCTPNRRYLGMSFANVPGGIVRLVDLDDHDSVLDFDLGAMSDSSLVLASSPDSSVFYAAMTDEGADSTTLSVIDTTDYSQVDIPGFRDPQSMVVSPDGRFLYVGGRDGVYFVDASSRRMLGVVEVGLPDYQVEVVGITPDGRHVYAVNSQSGELYRVDTADGKATCVTVLSAAEGSVMSADGTRLYTVHSDLQWISIHAL